MKMDTSKSKEDKLRKAARWAPYPKQELALQRPEFEVGFGGARGGGKTDAGMAFLTYDCDRPELHGAVIRKNGVDLGEWILRARWFFGDNATITSGNAPIIKFHPKQPDGSYKPGATYFLGHFKDKNAFSKYQGQNLARILIEELELIPSEENYKALLASCRSTIPGIKAQCFTTFNPGNVGHTWIKKRFGLTGIPHAPIMTKDTDTGRMRIFIPSTVEDNEALMKNDPDYVHFLDGLPDGMREQWRWGSWDDPIIKGAYYTLEMNQMRKDNRVIDLPHHPELSVHTWWDIGDDTTAIGFVQFVDDWIHVIDYYQNDSLGFPFYLTKLQEYREMRGYNYGIHHFPHDFDRLEWGSGRNRKEVLEEKRIDYEVVERPSVKQDAIDQTRILLARVKIDAHKGAQLVDALQNYRKEWDEEKQTFRDKPVHDWASHPADMMSYIAISNHSDLAPMKKSSETLRRDIKEIDSPRRNLSAEYTPDQQPGGNRGRFHYEE